MLIVYSYYLVGNTHLRTNVFNEGFYVALWANKDHK